MYFPSIMAKLELAEPGARELAVADAADVVALPVRERIQALDVLRGVAVGRDSLRQRTGVLRPGRSSRRIAPPPFRPPPPTELRAFLEHVFVDGKFYSIFSLLFGIGFGLQLARGGDAALPRFKRRLRILLAIGAVHAFLIWAGDILMLYALLGFTMPWFARKSDRELLRWTVILLAIPTALYSSALGSGCCRTRPRAGGTGPGRMPPEYSRDLRALGHRRHQGCVHQQPVLARRPLGRPVRHRAVPESARHVRAGTLDRAHRPRALTGEPPRHAGAVEPARLGHGPAGECDRGLGGRALALPAAHR